MSDLFNEESVRWASMVVSDGTTRHGIQGSIEAFAVEMTSTTIWLGMDAIDRDSNELRRCALGLSPNSAEIVAHSLLAAAKMGEDSGQDGNADNKLVFQTVVVSPDSPWFVRR